jgi:ACS family tartrate transporter-like MFS transporter
MAADVDEALARRTISTISWRLLPLIVAIYFVAYVDRSNVAFAALSMNRDLGFSATVYGWGAGMFFLGYFLFEVPSNIILHRVGARVWIARIMVTWGLVSASMVFVSGATSFYVIRFLLGVAEAGFFPGVLLYFTYWFPRAYRARVVAALFLAVPGSNAVAAALSGALLQLDGVLGLTGWRWMFLLESAPAILLAPVVLWRLTDRPAAAAWLAPDERAWLERALAADPPRPGSEGPGAVLRALTSWPMIGLSFVYFTIVTATYGIVFFLPLMVKSHGFSNVATGLITAIPYVVGAIGMVLVAYSSDRLQERRWHFALACMLSAIGLPLAGIAGSGIVALVAISVATIGLYASKPTFWPMPSMFVSGTAAAGGIALVNSVGNLGGFVGPFVVGWIRDRTHSYTAALDFLAACALASAILAIIVVRSTKRS